MKLQGCTSYELFFALMSVAIRGFNAVALSGNMDITIEGIDTSEKIPLHCLCYMLSMDPNNSNFSIENEYGLFMERYPFLEYLGKPQSGLTTKVMASYCQDCEKVCVDSTHRCYNCDSTRLWTKEISYKLFVLSSGKTLISFVPGKYILTDGTQIHLDPDDVIYIRTDKPTDDSIGFALINGLLKEVTYILLPDHLYCDNDNPQILNADCSNPFVYVKEYLDV